MNKIPAMSYETSNRSDVVGWRVEPVDELFRGLLQREEPVDEFGN